MIKIGSRTGHKIGILLVLTTLAIGSAAGLSWESPGSDTDYISGGYTLNVTGASDNSSKDVNFYYDDGNGWERFANGVTNSGDSTNPYWTTPIDSNLGSVTDLDLKANFSSGSDFGDSTTVTLDKGGPDSFSLNSPSSLTKNANPAVEVEVTDSYSLVENISMKVVDSDGNDVNNNICDVSSSTATCSIDISSDLEDETYDVEVTAYDSVGNSQSPSSTLSFTVDTTKDFSSDVSFDPSPGIILMDGDKDLDIELDSVGEDVTITCLDGSGDTIDEDSGSSTSFTCEVDEDDYGDEEVDISVEVCDDAGNCETSSESTFNFDVTPPSVTGLEIPIKADLYNSNFDVDFSAYDSASEVEEVEYYFDSSTSYGEGTAFDYSSDTDSYEIDTSSLSAGDHTLYVRARDEAERWSSPRTVDFSFDPDAVPEISLDVPGNVSVTAGQRKKFDVTIENTGELHISSIELSGSAEGVFSDSESISGLEPGESITVSLRIDTKASNIGQHKVQISTDNPSMTEEIDLLVEANSDQRSRIDADLSEHQSKLQEMEANVTALRQKVSEDKKQRLDANFSTFKQKVEDAQSAVDRGDYYEADSILEGIEQDQSAAKSSYEAVQKEYKNNQFWMFIFLGLGGFVVLGGGAIAALTYTDEVDFDVREYLEDLQEVEFDFDASAFEKYTDKVKKAMEGKDTSEAEEFEWEGFDSK